MNITDVDDKTIKRSINEGIPLRFNNFLRAKIFEDLDG